MQNFALPSFLVEQTDTENISLNGLSPESHRLIRAILADSDLMACVLEGFSRDKKLNWSALESLAGPITATDKRILELLAELFVPDSTLEFIVCGTWNDPN